MSISVGREDDPIVQAVYRATGLEAKDIRKITLIIEANEVSVLMVEKYVTVGEAQELSDVFDEYELHRRVPE